MKTKNVEIAILINGNQTTEYSKDTDCFIEAREGTEYAIKIKNHNDYKVKIVLAADGINVIDSKPLGDDPNEMGYIVEPYLEYVIKGYRVDENSVASFKFAKGEKAYANTVKGQKGKTQGVISARVYREKITQPDWQKQIDDLKDQLSKKKNKGESDKEYIPYPIYPEPVWPYVKPWNQPTWTCNTYQSSAGSNSSTIGAVTYNAQNNNGELLGASMPEPSKGSPLRSANLNYCRVVAQSSIEEPTFNLGTEFGKKIEQSVREVSFQSGDKVCDVIIYYTTRANLEKLGIDLKKVAKVSQKPLAFPADKKYCAIPSGWNG